MTYKEIIQQSIDLHVHVGPEIIPRLFTVPELQAAEKNKLRGIAVKNHFFPTSFQSASTAKGMPFIINSVVLNRYVGGLNADAVRASAEINDRPIIVWFPTLHAEPFLSNTQYEIPKEWISKEKRKDISFRLAKDVAPVLITNLRGNIRSEAIDVLSAIKKYDAILATGHLSWQDARVLVKVAVEKFDIRRIIVTHPIYQKIAMPIAVQKELADLGAFIEHCYSMYTIDKIAVKDIARQIREVGADKCVLSSDVGQSFSPKPSDALLDFMRLLEQEGITKSELATMLVDNPIKIIERI